MILSSFIVVFDILSNVTTFFILDFQCLLVDLERPNLEFDVFLGEIQYNGGLGWYLVRRHPVKPT